MKLNHTPLGVVASNKKPIFGLAALAVAGGVASSLVFNTQAFQAEPELAVANPTVYAVVGPDYFITSGLGSYLSNENITNVYVADTDIADFYGNKELPKKEVAEKEVKIYKKGGDTENEGEGENEEPGTEEATEEGTLIETKAMSREGVPVPPPLKPISEPASEEICETAFACLQGYEIGETEIVVEYEGGNTEYIPLKSVKLNPEAFDFAKLGETITGTGSLEGASNDLLRLRGISGAYGIDSEITGERSWSITSSEDADTFSEGASLIWTIGNQLVGGGTEIGFVPVYGVDANKNEENEEVLEDAFISVLRTIFKSRFRKGPGGNIVTEDGVVADLDSNALDTTPYSYYKVVLEHENITRGLFKEMPQEIRESFDSSLPEDVNELTAMLVRPRILLCETESNGIKRVSSNDDCEEVGQFMTLGQDIKLSFDVSDEESVKDGYVRKYYANVYEFREDGGAFRSAEVEYDAENQTVTVNGPIGIYGYGYIDELKPVEKEEEKDTPAVPNTGSTEQKATSALTISFLPFIIAAIAGAVITRKKSIHKLAKRFNHFN